METRWLTPTSHKVGVTLIYCRCCAWVWRQDWNDGRRDERSRCSCGYCICRCCKKCEKCCVCRLLKDSVLCSVVDDRFPEPYRACRLTALYRCHGCDTPLCSHHAEENEFEEPQERRVQKYCTACRNVRENRVWHGSQGSDESQSPSLKPTNAQYKAVVTTFKQLSDGHQHKVALQGLNADEAQLIAQIASGTFESIHHAREIRDVSRQLVEDFFGAPVYNQVTKAWE